LCTPETGTRLPDCNVVMTVSSRQTTEKEETHL